MIKHTVKGFCKQSAAAKEKSKAKKKAALREKTLALIQAQGATREQAEEVLATHQIVRSKQYQTTLLLPRS